MQHKRRRNQERASSDDPASPGTGGWRAEDFEKVTNEELARIASPHVLESEAYFELWRRTHALVSGIVHQRLHGQDARHTVTAFFCHKLPRVLHQFTPRSHAGAFEAWLATVTRNYLNDEWRREKTRRTRHVSLDDVQAHAAERAQALSDPPQVDRQGEQDHLIFFLREVMNQLLEQQDRYIFQARYWEDKTLKEIAAELGLTEENVRVRHFRARKRLEKACAIYREAGIL